MKRKIYYYGFLAFAIVIGSVILGHALMKIMEDHLLMQKYTGALIVGVMGVILLFIGFINNEKKILASMFGLLAGMLVWTGWVEFNFVWVAADLKIPGIFENGEEVSKPEYLIMPATVGLFAIVFLYYLFTKSGCPFFSWLQKTMRIRKYINQQNTRNLALTTFMESIVLMWFGYVVLMTLYNPRIAGDRHLVIWFVLIGSLVWSGYHGRKLIRLRDMAYAIRYATSTTLIFWLSVEILGRWGIVKEIWVEPREHAIEMFAFLFVFVVMTTYVFLLNTKLKNKKHMIK